MLSIIQLDSESLCARYNFFFFFNDTATTEIYTLSLHDALPIYDYARLEDYDGIDETCRIDRTLHSLLGASKAAADLVAQEYGRYFKMRVGILRGGCLTGPSHSGVELHGFLSYLVKVTLSGGTYSVFGHKGKQVRDNIHSYDVVRAIEE